MTQEEKQLLLKDLCSRLPYALVIHTDYKDIKLDRNHCGIGVLYYEHYSEEAKKDCGYDENDFSIIISGCFYGDTVKPYLRPMSSMTEEEKQWSRWYQQDAKSDNFMLYMSRYVEWLDSNHFDWRTDGNGKTLIEKGLALEAPEGMYA